MAKGKHAAALFEVIHSNKRLEPASASLNTPKWWFKGRPAGSSRATGGAPAGGETPIAENLVDPGYSTSAPDPTEPAYRSAPSLTSYNAGDSSRGGSARGSAAHGTHVDPQRQELNLKMRFSTAVISGFALLVAVGVAYVMGRHVAGGPQSASAQQEDVQQTEQIRRQPPQRGALDVQQRRPARSGGASVAGANGSNAGLANSSSARSRTQDATGRSHGQQVPAANANILSPDASAPDDATPPKRSFGLNYVLVQSWPADHAQTAQQACDYLKKYGVLCTVEPAPAGFHRGWVAVISTRGFDRISSAECQAYVARIEKVGERFGRSIDHFQPQLFKLK